MARLRSEARKRAEQRRSEAGSPTTTTRELIGGRARVAAIGTGPPMGSQENPPSVVLTHNNPPSPTKTSRQQLQEALRAKVNRDRRGQGGQVAIDITTRGGRVSSGRRGEAATSNSRQQVTNHLLVAPAGWKPPQIVAMERSPVALRPRQVHGGGPPLLPDSNNFPADNSRLDNGLFQTEAFFEQGVQNMSLALPGQVQHFTPGVSPPPNLAHNPVHSPSQHRILHTEGFPETQRVTVCVETLDLDPGLIGDAGGVSGLVKARFYHHITGTPMFQVQFGGAIGVHAVRVSDTVEDVAQAFTNTQRALFKEDAGPLDATRLLEVAASEDSSDDPDWEGNYADFEAEENEDVISSNSGPSYHEDPLQELGLYDYEEDITNWPFDKLFCDDQWQDQSITLVQDTNNFSGPTPGPTMAVESRPTKYFMRYWPPATLQRVVDETNRYAAQPSQLNPAVSNGRVEWTPLDVEELLVWFGILILMGLKEFPHIRCYWDRKAFYNCPLISEAMPRKRFEAIIRCLHLVNNDEVVSDRGHPAYDKLAKVRWLCESFAHMSQTLYNNERVLTVDEIMIPYKGRYCNIRQYMKAKPVKFGVKVWALANSESRYVSNIIVYLEADDARVEGDSVGEDAVLTAIAGLERRGHVIITDNFFTSPRLFMELLRRGFWATGTCRKTRKGFPSSLAGFPKTQLPE